MGQKSTRKECWEDHILWFDLAPVTSPFFYWVGIRSKSGSIKERKALSKAIFHLVIEWVFHPKRRTWTLRPSACNLFYLTFLERCSCLRGLFISPFSSRLSSRPSLVSCLVGRRESQACELVRVRKSCGWSLLIVFFLIITGHKSLLMPKRLMTFVMSELKVQKQTSFIRGKSSRRDRTESTVTDLQLDSQANQTDLPQTVGQRMDWRRFIFFF